MSEDKPDGWVATTDGPVRYVTSTKSGWVELICGCMFAGKTLELIRRLRRAEIAKKNVQVFKPVVDTRYDNSDVVSHDASRLKAVPVLSADKILTLVKTSTEVVGIDEAQFFANDLPGVCQQLADSGIQVIVAALDTDYRLEPFGAIPRLMAQAEYVTKLTAICVQCGADAYRTKRVSGGGAEIEIGGVDKYEARCRRCFNI